MSYSFNEICNFKKGEQYWESSQMGCIRFTLKDDPVVSETEVFDTVRRQVRFVGVTPEGEEVSYLTTEGLEHYGPSISDHKEYMTIEEIQLSKSRVVF